MSTVHFYCVLCGAALQTSSDSPYDLVKCACCSYHVPAPRLANHPANFAPYPSVFPPGVMELLVKFQCTACGSVLHADARCEGRDVRCPSCRARTAIPRWSNAPDSPFPSDSVEKAGTGPPRLPGRAGVPTLSVEEIDFLRGAESGKPEAAA